MAFETTPLWLAVLVCLSTLANAESVVNVEVAANNESQAPGVNVLLGQDAPAASATPINATSISSTKAPEIVGNQSSSVAPVVVAFADDSTGDAKTAPAATNSSSVPSPALASAGLLTNETLHEHHKFSKYLSPICSALERVNQKQMQTIQSQFKRFVQISKTAHCLMAHYNINPALRPINKPDLVAICESREAPGDSHKFANFEKCLNNIWNPAMEKELSAIIDIRLIAASDHQHVANDTSLDSISHDSDDMNLIGQVISRVLNGTSSSLLPTNSASPAKANAPVVRVETTTTTEDTKLPVGPAGSMIVHKHNTTTDTDITYSRPNNPIVTAKPAVNTTDSGSSPTVTIALAGPTTTTPKPVVPTIATGAKTGAVDGSQTLAPSVIAAALADGSTGSPVDSIKVKLSFSKLLDKSSQATTTTTVSPTTAAPSTKPPVHSLLDSMKIKLQIHEAPKKNSTTATATATTVEPAAVASSSAKPTMVPSTSGKPIATSSTPVPAVQIKFSTSEPKSLKVILTNKLKPASNNSSEATTTSAPAPPSTTTAPAIANSTSLAPPKPFEVLEKVLKHQEQELADLEARHKVERESALKQVRKSQQVVNIVSVAASGEQAASNAIKSLQQQQKDEALKAAPKPAQKDPHQLEHERQMLLDPVGHTQKHREYERAKQVDKDKTTTTTTSTKVTTG